MQQCLECNILFVTEGKLKEHVQAKHKKKPTDKEKVKFIYKTLKNIHIEP